MTSARFRASACGERRLEEGSGTAVTQHTQEVARGWVATVAGARCAVP
jgi:hypothetical protein